MGYGDRDRGRGRQDDGKYVRLTGLWENRNKRGMFTGKIRNQDIQKIMRKFEECDGKRADVVVFLWENTNKRGQKDPDFTVQIAEAEDRGGGGRGGYSNRDRGRDDWDRNERDDRDGRSDRGGRAREDERDSSDREDERDGRDEDDRDSGRDDDGGEEDSERGSRPASKGKSKPASKGGSKSSRSGGVKDKAPAKGKGKKEDDW